VHCCWLILYEELAGLHISIRVCIPIASCTLGMHTRVSACVSSGCKAC
jgi:hypothetical protein